MTNTHQAIKQPRRLKLILVFIGVLLTLGWMLLLAITNWPADLPCLISPTNCFEGGLLANAILYSPAIVGAIILPLGFLYNLKMRREIKFVITIATASVSLFVTFWLLVYIGISIHGLRG